MNPEHTSDAALATLRARYEAALETGDAAALAVALRDALEDLEQLQAQRDEARAERDRQCAEIERLRQEHAELDARVALGPAGVPPPVANAIHASYLPAGQCRCPRCAR